MEQRHRDNVQVEGDSDARGYVAQVEKMKLLDVEQRQGYLEEKDLVG
jgi:hypothetical protein